MRKLILSVFLGLAMLLALSGIALAQTPTPAATSTPPVVAIAGKITGVDPIANTVKITPEGGAEITLNVVDTTDIEAPDKDPATIADLAEGQQVKAQYQSATNNAIRIWVLKAKAARVEGVITALDPLTQAVTITPRKGDPVPLTVTGETEIKVWGKDPATFADLKVDDAVRAEYDVTTRNALEIQVKVKGEPSPGVRQGFFGTVKDKTDTSLIVTTKQGDVTFIVNADTQYWIPPRKDATLADVNKDDRVAVLATKQDSTLIAKRVLVIPAKPTRIQISGTVTSIEGNTVTVTDSDGNTSTFDLPPGQGNKLAVGDVLTIVIMKTPGKDKATAQGSMRGDEMKGRLDNLRDKVKGQKADAADDKARVTKDLAKLEDLMQRNLERQQEMLQKALDKAPAQARDALEKAKDNALRGLEQAKEAVRQAKGTPTATATSSSKARSDKGRS